MIDAPARPLRAGIVGTGGIARWHAAGYAAAPGADLALVTDRDDAKARAFAQLHGARAVASVEELLDGVDVVSVCTPPTAHVEATVAALEAGKAVLCEKPIARSLEDAGMILDAAERSSGMLMIGLVSRFQADLRRAKQLVGDGELGRLVMARDAILMPFPHWSGDSWHGDFEQSGGALLDLGIHSFDYLAWLFGSPITRVHAVGVPAAAAEARHVLVNLRFADGGIGTVEVSWAYPPSIPFDSATELIGTEASVSWSYADTASLVVADGESREAIANDAGSFLEEVATFVRAVRDGAPSPIPGADGMAALRVALAAMRSLDSGETVELEPAGAAG